MPRYREGLTSFLRGEVSPKFYGRTEVADYKQACEKMRNAIVYPQGGAGIRPGSQYKFTLEDDITDSHPTPLSKSFFAGTFSNGRVKIVPFIVSETEAYLVVIGVGQGPGSNDSYPCVIYDAYDVSRKWIARMNGTIGSFQNAAYSYPRWYETTTDPQEIQAVPRGNVIFFAHERTMPWCLEYTGDFDQSVGGSSGGPFILRALPMFYTLGRYPDIAAPSLDQLGGLNFPYQAVNANTAKTLTLSADGAPGDSINITASAAGIITLAMQGCPIKITNSLGTTTGTYLIVDYNTGTNVAEARIIRVGGGTVATSFWSRSQWFSSNPGSDGTAFDPDQNATARYWPRAVSFFENRLIYGGNKTYPATVWGSTQGDVASFKLQKYANDASLTITNDMAFEFEIASTDFASIRWISSAKTLQVGTIGREYIAFGPNDQQSLGPLNVSFNGETNHGSTLVQPVRTENALIFVQRSGRKIREFTFNFAEDSYRSADLSLLSEHIFDVSESLGEQDPEEYPKLGNGYITQLIHQESPHGITWAIDSYGGLIGITRNRQLEITAFHHHLLAGAGVEAAPGVNNRKAKITTGCVIPSNGALHDDIWLVVEREIAGNPGGVAYVEMIGQEFAPIEITGPDSYTSDDPNNYFIYMDAAGVQYNATPFSDISFPHLAGETVALVGDHKYLGTVTLDASGEYTLPEEYNSVVAGLSYRAVIKPLNLEAGSAIGTSQGANKRIDELNMRFNRTIGAKFGPDEDTLEDIDFRPATLQDDAIPLFSGDKNLKFRGGSYKRATVAIVQDLPLPMQLTSLVARLVEND